MTVVETINQKVVRLPSEDQKKVLDLVEDLEERFQKHEQNGRQGATDRKHPLTILAEMAVDMGVTDLADRHDFDAHGKLED